MDFTIRREIIWKSETATDREVNNSIEGKQRKQKEIAVFVLKTLKKYDTPIPIKGITSSGRYLTEEEYNKIVNQATVKQLLE